MTFPVIVVKFPEPKSVDVAFPLVVICVANALLVVDVAVPLVAPAGTVSVCV